MRKIYPTYKIERSDYRSMKYEIRNMLKIIEQKEQKFDVSESDGIEFINKEEFRKFLNYYVSLRIQVDSKKKIIYPSEYKLVIAEMKERFKIGELFDERRRIETYVEKDMCVIIRHIEIYIPKELIIIMLGYVGHLNYKQTKEQGKNDEIINRKHKERKRKERKGKAKTFMCMSTRLIQSMGKKR